MSSYQPNSYKHDKHKIFFLCSSIIWQHKAYRKPCESQSKKHSTGKCFVPVALMHPLNWLPAVSARWEQNGCSATYIYKLSVQIVVKKSYTKTKALSLRWRLNSVSSPSGSHSERKAQQQSLKRPPDCIGLLLVHFQPSDSFLIRLTSSNSFFVLLLFFLNCGTHP